VDVALEGWLSKLIEQERFTGKLNKTLDFPTLGRTSARRGGGGGAGVAGRPSG